MCQYVVTVRCRHAPAQRFSLARYESYLTCCVNLNLCLAYQASPLYFCFKRQDAHPKKGPVSPHTPLSSPEL